MLAILSRQESLTYGRMSRLGVRHEAG
jgi:hypothetical protein